MICLNDCAGNGTASTARASASPASRAGVRVAQVPGQVLVQRPVPRRRHVRVQRRAGARLLERACPGPCQNGGVCSKGSCLCPPSHSGLRASRARARSSARRTGAATSCRACARATPAGAARAATSAAARTPAARATARASASRRHGPSAPTVRRGRASATQVGGAVVRAARVPVRCSGVGQCVAGECLCPKGRAGDSAPSRRARTTAAATCTATARRRCVRGRLGGVDCTKRMIPTNGCGHGHSDPEEGRVRVRGRLGRRRLQPAGVPEEPGRRRVLGKGCARAARASARSARRATTAAPTCASDCSHNGMCDGGKCVCFDGFEGADCSKASHDCNKRCATRCADICVDQCRPLFARSSSVAGRSCYLSCSRDCYGRCVRRASSSRRRRRRARRPSASA